MSLLRSGYHRQGWGAFKSTDGRYFVHECDGSGEFDPFSDKPEFLDIATWEEAKAKVDSLTIQTQPYQEHRGQVFTPDGVRALLDIRTKAACLIRDAGAFESSKVMSLAGDTFLALNCLDVLEEYGHIECLNKADAMGQHRVYTEGRRMSEL